jgi:hypothetical protein
LYQKTSDFEVQIPSRTWSSDWHIPDFEHRFRPPKTHRLVQPDGTKIVNRDLELYFATPDVAESDQVPANKFSANPHTAKRREHADVLNRTEIGAHSQPLNGSNRQTKSIMLIALDCQPSRLRDEVFSLRYVSHQLLAPISIAQTRKYVDIHLATKTLPFRQAMLRYQTLIPPEINDGVPRLLSGKLGGYRGSAEIKVHPITLEIDDWHRSSLQALNSWEGVH